MKLKNIKISESEIKINKIYPVKEFLKKRSRLLTTGKSQRDKIFEYRDEVMRRIKQEIRKYYKRVINGNYLYDGMPEIERGICG